MDLALVLDRAQTAPSLGGTGGSTGVTRLMKHPGPASGNGAWGCCFGVCAPGVTG